LTFANRQNVKTIPLRAQSTFRSGNFATDSSNCRETLRYGSAAVWDSVPITRVGCLASMDSRRVIFRAAIRLTKSYLVVDLCNPQTSPASRICVR
jgi:hypothetical protein